VGLYYRPFLALCFDEEQASLQKIAVQRMYLLLLCLVAISIVLLIQTIGTILVLALLSIPATIGALFAPRLSILMALACGVSILSTVLGLFAAYELNWPPGATIALIAAAGYVGTLLLRRKKIV
jgi:zinc transport system permease protein